MAIPRNNLTKIVEAIVIKNTKDKLERFREYTLEIEEKFIIDKSRLDQKYKDAIVNLSSDEISDLEDYYADEYDLIEEGFIDLYRKSTLVSIYSFLESSLNSLCGYLYRRYDFAVELADLRGEGIVRARNYLEKFTKVDFSILNDEWGDLKALNSIRNCIVHAEGDLTGSRSANGIRVTINSRRDLELRHEKYIKISREYLDFIITQIEEFMVKLYDQVFQAV